MPAVSGIVQRLIGGEVRQREVEHTLRVLDPEEALQLVLLDLERPLALVVGVDLEIAALLGVEELLVLSQSLTDFG